VKFGRKAQSDPVDADGTQADLDEAASADASKAGPFDSDEMPSTEDLERLDLGSLLIIPEPDRELRIQVDEASAAARPRSAG
jgi:hypothetical protein